MSAAVDMWREMNAINDEIVARKDAEIASLRARLDAAHEQIGGLRAELEWERKRRR